MHFLFVVVALALISVSCGEEDVASHAYDKATMRDQSLMSSTWPSDHGDSSRTKYTYHAGLPADFDASRVSIVKQEKITAAQWLYTAGEHSEFLFVMGGPPNDIFVAKLDSRTLEILQENTLGPALYIGGLLMHANGHVYAAHGNRLYRFKDADLTRKEEVTLPTTLNGNMVQTNGLVVSSDGLLVIKQWSMIFEDLALHLFFVPVLLKLVFAFIVLGASISSRLMRPPANYSAAATTTTSKGKDKGRTKKHPRRSWVAFLFHSLLGGVCGLLVFVTLITGGLRYILGPFDLAPFFFTNTPLGMDKGGGGQLKFINPDTLEVVADLYLPERASFGRMALGRAEARPGQAPEDVEDVVVLIGDEFIRQYRWAPSTHTLHEVEEWAARYRSRGEGSFPGTGPTIFNGATFFTDNTFPVFLGNGTYSMFRRELEMVDGAEPELQKASMVTPGDGAGFMFWSVVVSPLTNAVMAWDSANDNVQMRDADSLELRWRLRAVQSDCVTLAADRGHVYLSDHSQSPGKWAKWGPAIGKESAKRNPDIRKFLIVADVHTGNVLLNVTVQNGGGMKASLIVPGANDDVIIAGPSGLSRVYIK